MSLLFGICGTTHKGSLHRVLVDIHEISFVLLGSSLIILISAYLCLSSGKKFLELSSDELNLIFAIFSGAVTAPNGFEYLEIV